MVHKVQQERMVLQVQWGYLVRQALRELMVWLVQRERMVRPELQVQQEQSEQQA